jgi:hypothetical protein
MTVAANGEARHSCQSEAKFKLAKCVFKPSCQRRGETHQESTDSDPHDESQKPVRMTARLQRAENSSVFSE